MRSARKTKKRFIEAEDICRIALITSAVMSPDEKNVAYTVESISEDKQKYYSRLYLTGVDGGKPRQFTFGKINDRGIAWSPDGEMIAFVSTRDKKTGIYLMAASGGAEKLLLEMDGSFGRLAWTPDGTEIVFQFQYNDSHFVKDKKRKKEAPVFRHVTRLLYRLDGAGFLPQDRTHIWKVAVDTGKAVQLTKGKYDEGSPCVSSNGKLICFVSNRTKDPDLENLKDSLYVMPVTGGKEKKVPAPDGPKASPSFSPDNSKIAYLGHTNTDDAWGVTNFHVWTVGVSGKPAAKDVISKFDRSTVDATIGDMGEGFDLHAPSWTPDGKRLFFCASDFGSTHVFYVPARGGLPTRVTKKSCHVKDFSFGKAHKKLATVISTLKTPGELFVMPAVYEGDSKATVLDAPSKAILSKIDMPAVKEILFKAYDGTQLQGWLVTPPKFNKNKKYPGILEIHGGPRAQYGFTFYHEMLYLASKGYVVFYTNPRGGQGRGETFAGTIVGDWGTIDYSDCMAAADYLENLSYVNARKMGVTGGSYGGYMTNWMIGHTNRFKAAVT